MMYFVYILQCADGSLYTGITNNMTRRFDEHKRGTGGNYTRSRRVNEILYTEPCTDRSSALKREIQIKDLRREQKLALITSS